MRDCRPATVADEPARHSHCTEMAGIEVILHIYTVRPASCISSLGHEDTIAVSVGHTFRQRGPVASATVITLARLVRGQPV